MVRKDLVNYLVTNFGFTQAVSNTVISDILNEIKKSIKEGNTVKLKEFGVFKSKVANRKTYRDPRTGERVDVSAKKKVSFKVSNSFKRFMNS